MNLSDKNLASIRMAIVEGDIQSVLKFLADQPELAHDATIVDVDWSHNGRRVCSRDRAVETLWLLQSLGMKFEGLAVSTLDSLLRHHPRGAELTLQFGADPRVSNRVGATAMHRMAHIGNRAAAGILLKHPIDMNAETNQGATPLDVAVRCGHVRMSQFLYERGARESLEDYKPQAVPPTAQQLTVTANEGQLLGSVSWFEPNKWGYLEHEVFGSLFFAAGDLTGNAPESIEEGDFATFQVARDDFGLKAVEVEITKPIT